MAGTAEGNRKVRDRLLAANPNHYRDIGARGKKGGHLSPGSFQKGSAEAAKAGEKGGAISVRPPAIDSKVPITQLKKSSTTGKLVQND